MDVFKEAWEQQLQVLTEAVDDITGIEDFLATTGGSSWHFNKSYPKLISPYKINTLLSRKVMKRKKEDYQLRNIVVVYNSVFYILIFLATVRWLSCTWAPKIETLIIQHFYVLLHRAAFKRVMILDTPDQFLNNTHISLYSLVFGPVSIHLLQSACIWVNLLIKA